MSKVEEAIPDPLDAFELEDPFILTEHLPEKLVCKFFGVFSRLEFALKEAGFKFSYKNGSVNPDWKKFAQESGPDLAKLRSDKLEQAVEFITNQPPKVQNINLGWEEPKAKGFCKHGNSILHAVQVRHNLFHGGKHPPSDPKRNIELIKVSLVILKACLRVNDAVYEHYVTTRF